jgi:hypothetical protein
MRSRARLGLARPSPLKGLLEEQVLDRPSRTARPPPRPPPHRQRRYRQRVRAGTIIVGVELDLTVIEFLLASGWLTEVELDDRGAIGAALSRMLADTARGPARRR